MALATFKSLEHLDNSRETVDNQHDPISTCTPVFSKSWSAWSADSTWDDPCLRSCLLRPINTALARHKPAHSPWKRLDGTWVRPRLPSIVTTAMCEAVPERSG